MPNRQWRQWLGALLLLTTSGCAHQWTRPGGSPAVLAQDMAACMEEAEAKFSIKNMLGVFSDYSVAYGICNESMMACFPGDSVRILMPRTESRVVDVNEASRFQTRDRCLRQRGWQ